ncbi:sterol desaturase family protein [Sphingomonas tabacisoli]|uniref:Sterol desaturase family protein n=1 Tax=Sphingomonas tabacisoli TaxID=2249466 RepID=A0ABW4I728_9SPHN
MLDSVFSGEKMLQIWLYLFLAAGLGAGIITGFFKARKIQPRGFKWKIFRNEAVFAALNLAFSALLLGNLTSFMKSSGLISFHSEPTTWWVVALEYALYFFAFDTWFYWLHRFMHKEPVYSWVHKLHHKSTSPNLLTTLSVNPLESLINGGFVPLFLAAFTVHDATMALIGPTNVLMGLYVHSGYEFLPRWWNKSWATKWFISATFHDQHHRYFTGNFGGYTTIWDRLCGTMRPKFESDFLKVKDRAREVTNEPAPAV